MRRTLLIQNIFTQSGEWATILTKIRNGFIVFIHSLRWKLLLTHLCVSIVPILFLANTMHKNLDSYFIEERKIELKGQANMIAISIANNEYMASKEYLNSYVFEAEIARFSKQGNYRVIVLDENSIVVQDSNNTDVGKTYIIPEVIEAIESRDVAVTKPNNLIHVVTSIVDTNNNSNTRLGVVFLVSSTEDISENLMEVKRQYYTLTIVTVLILLIIVFVVSQVITNPIKKVSQVINEIAMGHLHQRVKVTGNDEMSNLSESVNVMAEKLEKVDATRQTFVANVSHELKTPLSSIKVLCESILFQNDTPKETYVEFLQDINSEVDRMAAIIDDLLNLVKMDQHEKTINMELKNINELIIDIIKRLKPIATERNIDIAFEELKTVVAVVDETKLTLAITNLIENSIKYTNVGGLVKISIDSDHQNSFITVADNGIGIAEEELPRIFERFYRVDKTRDRETGGTGLGLAITHSVVLLHGGSIKVMSKENEGTTFTIRIPLSRPTNARE